MDRLARQERGERRWRAARRCRPISFTILDEQGTMSSLTQRRRLFEHRLENWTEFAGRGVDDLENLSGSGLLVQGFARLGNQPRILHRDHGLGGKVLQQRDLL